MNERETILQGQPIENRAEQVDLTLLVRQIRAEIRKLREVLPEASALLEDVITLENGQEVRAETGHEKALASIQRLREGMQGYREKLEALVKEMGLQGKNLEQKKVFEALKIVAFLEDVAKTHEHLCALHADVPMLLPEKGAQEELFATIVDIGDVSKSANDESYTLAA